jgi:hypothetical protein
MLITTIGSETLLLIDAKMSKLLWRSAAKNSMIRWGTVSKTCSNTQSRSGLYTSNSDSNSKVMLLSYFLI